MKMKLRLPPYTADQCTVGRGEVQYFFVSDTALAPLLHAACYVIDGGVEKDKLHHPVVY